MAELAQILKIPFILSKKQPLPRDLCVLCGFARKKTSLMQYPG